MSPYADASQVFSGVLHTKDNIVISYDQYKRASDSVIIICPGFFNSKANRWMRKTVDILSSVYDVIIFDFRGHGSSGGKYTWSAKENLDVDTIVDYAVSQKYKHIGILAFSLGAVAAVNDAASRNDIDSMVLISCPAAFKDIDFHFWEPGMLSDFKDNIDCKWQGKGVRIGSVFMKKEDAIDSISRINKTSLLFIHGDSDWIVKAWHSQKLYDAAKVFKEIEIVKGGLHAERLIQSYPEKMRELILGWFSKTFK